MSVFTILSEARSGRTLPGGEVLPSELAEGDLFMHPSYGLLRFVALRDGAVHCVRVEGSSHFSFSATAGVPLARLGSEAEIAMVHRVLANRFSRLENLPLVFAWSALNARAGYIRHGTTAGRAMNEQYTRMLQGILPPGVTFEQGMRGWSAQIRTEPPSTATIEALGAAIRRLYELTGENLVRSGVIHALGHPDGHGHIPSEGLIGLGGLVAGGTGIHETYAPLLGGNLAHMHAHLDHALFYQGWQRGLEALYDGNVPSTPFRIALTTYVPRDAAGHTPGSESATLLQLQNAGTPTLMAQFLEPHHARLVELIADIRARHPDQPLTLAPTPSSTPASSLFATALGAMSGIPVTENLLLRNPGSTRSQTVQPYLWNRLFNVASPPRVKLRTRAPVAGRIIIVTDDMLTSGATEQQIRDVLMRAGAGAVYFVALARTRR